MTMIEALQKLVRLTDRRNYKAPETLAGELAELADEFATIAGGSLRRTGAEETLETIRAILAEPEWDSETIEEVARAVGASKQVAASLRLAVDGSQDEHDDEAISVQVWPKKCPTCSRVLNEAGWASLKFAGFVGCVRSGGRRYAVELRECICTSHIGVQVELPMAVAMGSAPKLQEEPPLPYVTPPQAATTPKFGDLNPNPCNCSPAPGEEHASGCSSWIF